MRGGGTQCPLHRLILLCYCLSLGKGWIMKHRFVMIFLCWDLFNCIIVHSTGLSELGWIVMNIIIWQHRKHNFTSLHKATQKKNQCWDFRTVAHCGRGILSPPPPPPPATNSPYMLALMHTVSWIHHPLMSLPPPFEESLLKRHWLGLRVLVVYKQRTLKPVKSQVWQWICQVYNNFFLGWQL